MLDVVFALDRQANVIVMLEINEPLDGIGLGKSRDQAIAVLVNTSDKVARNPTYKMPLGALARM